MTYRGRVQGGVVVLDEPGNLPEGLVVRIEVSPPSAGETTDNLASTLGQRLLKFAGAVKGLPSDLARNHDHYLHGTPKK